VQVLPLFERQLKLPEHPYPITLSDVRDFRALRLEISSAQRTLGGNGGSRIRLRFTLSRSWSTSVLEDFWLRQTKKPIQRLIPGVKHRRLTQNSWRLG
jgi:hypothetical protein